uniref:Uncharacterized protein n=1 Tax=Solanum tuberosum TaxID=4113 RepID=M1C9D5_SOLTU
MPLHEKKNLWLCMTQQLQAQEEWNSPSAKLVKLITPRNSLRMPDKIENHIVSKPDISRLKCKHQHGQEIGCTGMHTGHQPSKSSKLYSSQLVTIHPSHKQNQASKYKKREAKMMSSENTKRDFHFTRLSKDPKLSTC